jgi:hypothetical protein
MASHCSTGSGALWVAIISVGLNDDDAVVACNGVTACDHAINAATASPIPMVPVEKKSCLRMTASFVFVNAAIMDQPCFRILPLP